MAKPKTSTILLLGALGLSLGVGVYLYLSLNSEQARRVWAEGQLEQVTRRKEELEKEREQLLQAKQSLETQLTDSTTKAEDLANQLAEEKRAKEALTGQLTKAQGEQTKTKSQLDSERKDKELVTQELAKAKQSYQALSNELTTLRQAKEALEKRVKEMLTAKAQEAERIVVKPGTPSQPATPSKPAAAVPAAGAKPKEGKVLVVNREYNFVVMNMGSKDGIKTGTQVSVLRGDKTIGKGEVERVYENMSAANLLQEEKKGQVQEGDIVRLGS